MAQVRYLTIPKFAEYSGYTADAIRTKIRDGIWAENHVFKKAPDGRVLIDVEGYIEWVETGEESAQRQKAPLKLRLSTKASVAGSASRLSPPPLI